MEVGKIVTLTLPLTDTTATNTTRNYRVKVYCTRNGVAYPKIDTTYTIPIGSKTTSRQFPLVFTNPGQFSTCVEILYSFCICISSFHAYYNHSDKAAPKSDESR